MFRMFLNTFKLVIKLPGQTLNPESLRFRNLIKKCHLCESVRVNNSLIYIQKGDQKIPLIADVNDYVVVYTDGACLNNGKPNAKAGIGVWFGDNNPLNVSKPIKGRATNNTAEIQACLTTLKIAKKYGLCKLKIVSDSQFVIKSVTQWMYEWKNNNWRTTRGSDVKNKTDFIKLDKYLQLLDVKWEHVQSHSGIKGNEEANKLAQAGALKYKPKPSKE